MTSDVAFDPSRLVPLEEPQFDPSRLVPAEEPSRNVFREKTQTTVAAPPGLRPDQIEYLDDVQNNKKQSGQFFGHLDLGDPIDFLKGYMRQLVGGSIDIATFDLPSVEKKLGALGTERKEFKASDIFTQFLPTTEGAFARVRASEKFGGSLTFAEEEDKLRRRLQEIKDIRAREPSVVEAMGIGGEDNFISMLGGGAQNLAQSMGTFYITGNPILSMSVLGAQQKMQSYQEARDVGLDVAIADESSNVRAGLMMATEAVGTTALFKALGDSSALQRAFKGFLINGTEEGSQQILDIMASNKYGVTDIGKNEALFQTSMAFLIGGLIGAPVSAVFEINSDALKSTSERLNIPEEAVVELAKAVEGVAEKSPSMRKAAKEVISKAVNDETGPLKKADREAAVAQTQKIFNDFVQGKEIDTTSLPQEVQDILSRVTEQPSRPTILAEAGKPITLFHSTTSTEPFTRFDLSQSGSSTDQGNVGRAVYLTPSSAVAQATTQNQGSLIQTQAFVTNPIEITRDNTYKEQISKAAKNIGVESVPEWSGTKQTSAEFAEEFSRKAQEAGYDSVITRLPNNAKDIAEVAVFDPDNVRIIPAAQPPDAASGGQGGRPPARTPLSPQRGEPDRDGDYAKIAAAKPKGKLRRDAADLMSNASDLAADAFVPVSTRLGNIDKKLKHAVRRFVFDVGLSSHNDHVTLKPFVEGASDKMTPEDYRVLDFALKNRDAEKVGELMVKYGLEEAWAAVRGTLENIRNEAIDAGIEVGFIEDYFPRKVQRGRVAEFMAFMRGKSEWSEIQTAMDKEDPSGEFSPEEQAEFVNKWLRGYKNNVLQNARPSFAKERSIDYITPEMNEFYDDSVPALINYVSAMRHGTEVKKLFGGTEGNIDSSIGAYVAHLIEDGLITPSQELEMRKILKAVVDPTGTRGVITWLKNATYVYTMGSPISALTQVQDLAWSLHANGYYRTAAGLGKAIAGGGLTKEDIGVSNILQEFEGGSRSSNAVRAIFKSIGLSAIDDIGKSAFLNASLSRMKKAAAKDNQEFINSLDTIFGDESAQVLEDIKSGDLTENVRYLLFSELSDFQPVSLAEMPVGYLRGGNGRFFYALKTYTMKQMDIYRREIFDNLSIKDPAKNLKALRNLISLGSALMLMGMPTDALKDFLLGRETELSDLVTDNILKTMGASKYQIYKSKRDGIMSTFWTTMTMPPLVSATDDLVKDVKKVADERQTVGEMSVWSHIPWGGKFYYWWFGGGSDTEKR